MAARGEVVNQRRNMVGREAKMKNLVCGWNQKWGAIQTVPLGEGVGAKG
jgi:hypothetical protein